VEGLGRRDHPPRINGKSAGRRKRWLGTEKASIDAFVEVVGDLPMADLDRDHARRFYDHRLRRIAPAEGRPTHSASLGNRRLGDLRVLYREFFRHLGEPDRRNPFDQLSFRERAAGRRRRRRRLPFSTEWIVGRILAPGALSGLDAEARAILLVVADTGARPREICNLTAEAIHLDAEVPHIVIEPRDDPDDPREIKTESSIRLVPLVGLALAAMRAHPAGFPRYKDKEDRLSATLDEYLEENGLRPSAAHSVHSFRHSFEDRMKEAGIGDEMRRGLMGHTIDRPAYGEGGSLALRHAEMIKVTLPFDPSIV
jgi:integrase